MTNKSLIKIGVEIGSLLVFAIQPGGFMRARMETASTAVATKPTPVRRKTKAAPKPTPVRPRTRATPKPPPPLQCTKSNPSNEPMTYLVGSSKLSKAEKQRIAAQYGKLVMPDGETERAKEIRRQAEKGQRDRLDKLNDSYKKWLIENPDAPEAERRKREELVASFINRWTKPPATGPQTTLPSWDWRRQDIDVGPVYDQGTCDVCWAFAAASAAEASIQKRDFDQKNLIILHPNMETSSIIAFEDGFYPQQFVRPGPFVQDLLNCMPIEEKDICKQGWHGTALQFMTYGYGMPISYRDDTELSDPTTGVRKKYRRIFSPGRKFECRPNIGFKKALAWDYITSPPDRQPTVAELKEALIKYGPIVAPITFSDCLRQYRGGVFNENDTDIVNHVVLLIGWDDKKQAWLVKNSWGENWGEKGFGWIKYGSSNFGVFAAWIDTET